MGGHGGLNILPQKKWNVYNYDNRAIVDKDKKEAETKKREKYENDRLSMLQGKFQVLRQENGYSDNNEKIIEKEDVLVKTLNQEYRKLNEKTHINLFQRQQQIIQNKELLEIKKLKQAQFLKDKNMDYSSKFLGTYANDNKKAPWYIRQKGYVETKKKPVELQELLSVKKSDTRTTGQVVKLEKNDKRQRQESRYENDRSRDKNYRIKEEPKTEMDILREKRLKREQKEKQKAQKLKSRFCY